MMRWIVRSSLQLRFIVVALAVGMVGFGATRVSNMPVDVFPEFAPPFVEVQTEGLGMSTEEVETLITIPMEQALNSTPGLETMRSTTVPGLSAITLIFHRGTDPLQARQLVNERVATAIPSLPASAGIPWTLQPLSATSRAMKIGLDLRRSAHLNRPVDDGLLDDAVAPDWRCPAWRTSRSGDRCAAARQFQMDPREARRPTTSRSTTRCRSPRSARLRAPEVHRRRQTASVASSRRRTSGSASHHACPCSARSSSPPSRCSGRYKADGTPLAWVISAR